MRVQVTKTDSIRRPEALTRHRVVRVGMLLALAALAVMSPPLAAQSGGVSLALGTPAPAAELEDLDGNAVFLMDYIEPGKPAVFEFWATWLSLIHI